MNQERYSLPAMLLHWLSAALVLWLFWRGFTMLDLAKGAERSAAYSLHKSLGLTVLLLTVLRLLWRHRCPPPALPAGPNQRAAKAVHAGLYGFLLLTPLAGYLASAFTPYPMRFFGYTLPRLVDADPILNTLFKDLHACLVWYGLALLFAHLSGVLLHLVRGENVLPRMLPVRCVQRWSRCSKMEQ